MRTYSFAAALASALFLASCSGSPVVVEQPPVISVAGVAHGAVYDGPVTISISVDRGSYTATLNQRPFSAGGTVADPGAYVLEVSARSGTKTSTLQLAFTVRFAGARVLIVRMLDLGDNGSGGGGDAILLTDSAEGSMRHALIDAGPSGADASDPAFVARRLAQLGVARLDFVQLTHAHADHYAGIPRVLETIPTGWFVYNGQVRSRASYEAVLAAAAARADTVVVPDSLTTLPFGLGEGPARVVPPLATFLANGSASNDELNEGSLGTTLRRGSFRMFFTGDGEVLANQRWRSQFATLTSGVTGLKVGHHGANNAIFDNGFSGTSTWLSHTAPAIALISANGRTHPRVNALGALRARTRTETYCTSVHGDVTIRIAESGQYAVTVQRNAGADCVPGSEAST